MDGKERRPGRKRPSRSAGEQAEKHSRRRPDQAQPQKPIAGKDAQPTDPKLAGALSRSGFGSRRALARAHPDRLHRMLAGNDVSMEPRQAAELVLRAQGHDLDRKPIDYRSILNDFSPEARENLRRLGATGLEPERDDSLERMLAVRRAHGIMQAVGVDNLADLGPVRVEARRELQAGTYVGRPSAGRQAGGQRLENDLIRRARVHHGVTVLADSLHFQPKRIGRNGGPVDEAILLGSTLEFVQDGQLVLSSDLSSLVIITERIDSRRLTRISYVFFDVPPATRASEIAERADDATRWDRNHFTQIHKDSNTGKDGKKGSNGSEDTLPGHAAPPAPDLALYVLETPAGLPEMEFSGRPGGRGAKGQDGGHGGDGAKGRPSKTELAWCKRGVGHGGRGGNGGAGGPGGDGGTGGQGGQVKLFTLPKNLKSMFSRKELQINVTGGAGGAPGEPGSGGDPGRGGKAGEPSWQCPHEPDRVGKDGDAGAPGAEGLPGERGERGSIQVQTLAVEDWEAIYESPWIEILDPWWAKVGETVAVHAVNLTPGIKLRLDGKLVQVEKELPDQITFEVPEGSAGGLHSVQLEVPNEHPLYSNQILDFHVLPTIKRLTETLLLPGDIIEIHGSGFTPESEVKIDDVRYPAALTADDPARLHVQLPDYEQFPFAEGTYTLAVINEDGGTSNSVSIEFDLHLIVPVRVWRVVPDQYIGAFHLRSPDWIRKMFTKDPTVNDIWKPYGIEIALDERIDNAVIPATLAHWFPPLKSDFKVSQLVKEKDGDGNFLHFDPGAINIYFVQEIAGFFLYGYATANWIIYQDTTHLSAKGHALVMAHEIGHSLGLNHVCDNKEKVTLFKRPCKSSDNNFLMHPHANKGPELTETEAVRARKYAAEWYRKMLGRS